MCDHVSMYIYIHICIHPSSYSSSPFFFLIGSTSYSIHNLQRTNLATLSSTINCDISPTEKHSIHSMIRFQFKCHNCCGRYCTTLVLHSRSSYSSLFQTIQQWSTILKLFFLVIFIAVTFHRILRDRTLRSTFAHVRNSLKQMSTN